MTDWKTREKEQYQDLTDRVNLLYEGFTPMQVRRCVISGMESQMLDLSMRDLMSVNDGILLNIWKLEDEGLYAADVRWDNEHPEVVAFNSSSRDEEPVPEEYGDPNISIKELLDGTV